MARSKETVWEADTVEAWTTEIPSKDQIFEAIVDAATTPASEKKSPTKSKSTDPWKITEEEKKEQVWEARKPTKDEIFLADKEVIWDKKVLDDILPLPTHNVVIDGISRMLYYPIPEKTEDYLNQLSGILNEASKTLKLHSSGALYHVTSRGEPFNWHFENAVVRIYQTHDLPEGDIQFALKVIKKYYPNVVLYSYPNQEVKKEDYAQRGGETPFTGEICSSRCRDIFLSKKYYRIDDLIASLISWVDDMNKRNSDHVHYGRDKVWNNKQEEVQDPFRPTEPTPKKTPKEPHKRKPRTSTKSSTGKTEKKSIKRTRKAK